MAVVEGEVTLRAESLEEWESLRARAVADPDINLVSESKTNLTLTVYFDSRRA